MLLFAFQTNKLNRNNQSGTRYKCIIDESESGESWGWGLDGEGGGVVDGGETFDQDCLSLIREQMFRRF